MSGFYGADTDQLRDHSALLRNRARRIGELQALLHPTVMDESAWHGPDADAFRADWSSRTAPLLDQIAAEVMRHGHDLEGQAEEQDGASGAGTAAVGGGSGLAGSSGSSGSGSGGGRSWWDRAVSGLSTGLGVFNTLQNAYTNGKSAWDILRIIDSSGELIEGAADLPGYLDEVGAYGNRIADSVFSAGTQFSSLAQKLVGELPWPVPTGAGNVNLFGWVDDATSWASRTVPFLDDAAPFVGRALPGLDVVFGGAQMIEGIQSGDTFSAVTGGAGALGGGLMLAGGALSATGIGAVIGGPMVAAGAILSGGAALADVGRMVYENWDSISATASDAWNATTDFVGDAAGAVTETAGNVVDAVSDGISGAVDGLADALPW